jgi:hypothetical protein
MEIDLFFVREKVLAKQISVVHIPGTDQLADILTKPIFLQTSFFSLETNLMSAPDTKFEGGVLV